MAKIIEQKRRLTIFSAVIVFLIFFCMHAGFGIFGDDWNNIQISRSLFVATGWLPGRVLAEIIPPFYFRPIFQCLAPIVGKSRFVEIFSYSNAALAAAAFTGFVLLFYYWLKQHFEWVDGHFPIIALVLLAVSSSLSVHAMFFSPWFTITSCYYVTFLVNLGFLTVFFVYLVRGEDPFGKWRNPYLPGGLMLIWSYLGAFSITTSSVVSLIALLLVLGLDLFRYVYRNKSISLRSLVSYAGRRPLWFLVGTCTFPVFWARASYVNIKGPRFKAELTNHVNRPGNCGGCLV